MKTKLKKYPKQIAQLERTIVELKKYRAMFVSPHSYQYTVIKSALRELNELLREEKRGWSD